MSLSQLLDDKEAAMVEAWLLTWRANRESGGYSTGWVPGLIEHIYGTELGGSIVRQFGW
jgi:hypothetical protein